MIFFFIAKDRLSGISFICILLDYTYTTHSHILLTLHFFPLSKSSNENICLKTCNSCSCFILDPCKGIIFS